MMNLGYEPRRRGAFLVAVTWLLVALVALALIFASRMATENVASANHLAQLQAQAIELGAEQFVREQITASSGDAWTIYQIPADQMAAQPVGEGYFWLLRPSADNAQEYDFGIIDEAGKININSANSDILQQLPNMTMDLASAITTWRSPTGPISQNGFGDSYYLTLPDPYHCKGAPFESVEEMFLLKDVTKELLFGLDLNRNGTLDSAEQNAGTSGTLGGGATGMGGGTMNNNQDDGRGWFNSLTAYSVEPNTATGGGNRTNINSNNGTGANNLITRTFPTRATAILNRLRPYRNFQNVFDFYVKAGLTPEEFTQIIDQITVTSARTTPGLININTASKQVLRCLPGLDDNDAASLITKRQGNSTTGGMAWVVGALSPEKLVGIGGYITGRSFQYAADIVAVSGNGRAYKRVRLVLDTRTNPYVMVYRKDLTDLGWPLDPAIRDALRAGKSPSGATVIKGGN